MNRQQLEHIIRASAGISGADQFVIIGSQAILGQFPVPPTVFTESMEADVYSLRNPEDAVLIEGSIGEGSPFHRTFGYYAHGVAEETAKLPTDWKDRLIEVRNSNTAGAVGLCLEVHDLVVSKLVAGRDKDLEFVAAIFKHSMAQKQIVAERLKNTPLDDRVRSLCESRFDRLA
jgi:hypothetical protein